MFRDRTNAIATAILGAAIVERYSFVTWGVVNAIWAARREARRYVGQPGGEGACWAVIAERARFIVCGAYSFAEQWRPAALSAVRDAAYASAVRALRSWPLLGLWITGCPRPPAAARRRLRAAGGAERILGRTAT